MLKEIADQLGPSTIMCSAVIAGDDCDNPASYKCWIGDAEDEWVGVCTEHERFFRKTQKLTL